MLLLVLNSELEQRCRRVPSFGGCLIDKPGHCRADMVAIGGHDIDRRARQQPALRPRVPRADRLVIRIEQVGEGRVKDPLIRIEPLQDKGLEKPGRMRKMPLCRADIGHRLDRLILGRQIGRQCFAFSAHLGKPLERSIAIHAASFPFLGTVEHGIPQTCCIALLTPPLPGGCASRGNDRADGARSSLSRAVCRWHFRPAPPSKAATPSNEFVRATTQAARRIRLGLSPPKHSG